MFTDPLGYFITWTCYGTWLPGDERGWTKWQKGETIPQPLLADWCREQMKETPVVLDQAQRNIVELTINQHCQIRHWHLHAVNCRSNHCHVVVTAIDYFGEVVRDQFKAWCARKLREQLAATLDRESRIREHWWTGNGSVRLLFDEESLQAAVEYTLEAQDAGGSKAERM